MIMPDIVYVDDDPKAFINLVATEDRPRFDPHEPDDGEAAFKAADSARIWLFDYFYDDNSDQARPPGENGLSTFQKWRSAFHEDRPLTAVVSNDLPRALGRDIPASRSHLLAVRASVEWVGPKTEASARQVVALADAAGDLTSRIQAWLDGMPGHGSRPASVDTETLCFQLLAAPTDVAWRTSIVRHVDRARPPRLATSVAARGLTRSILGWLLHAVIPYQSFLLTRDQAAVRLGLVPTSLAAASGGDSTLSAMLDEARYRGPLVPLAGDRWWRAGIDNLVWQLSSGNSDFQESLKLAAGGLALEFLPHEEPVLVSDPDLVETGEIAEARDCVRAQSDDFPADVPPAWVTISSAREDRLLASKVIFEDRDLLSESEAA